jgi:putative tricarboxylic transport membrane protein
MKDAPALRARDARIVAQKKYEGDMKKLTAILGGVAILAWQGAAAQNAGWKPDRVEFVVSVAPGGGTDQTARLLQEMLRKTRLVTVNTAVVNMPAGGGDETWTYLRQHAGDGRYLAISTPPLLTNRMTGAGGPAYTDFTPITNLYNEYVLVAVRADSPIRSGRDLAERFRKDASSVSIAVAPALGSHNHIAPALVARAAGGDPKKLRVEVFKTGTEAAAAAIDSRVDIVSSTVGTLLPEIRSGKLRPLGITAPRRLGGPLAAMPTWKEQGFDVVLPAWRGVLGPPGMTPAQLAYWEDVFLKLSLDADWLEALTTRWWDGGYLSSSETRRFLEGQDALLRGALTALGLAK